MEKPTNANEECVGPNSEQAGKASSCAGCPNQGACASGEAKKEQPQDPTVALAMSKIKHRILVLSGKGGVGKSTFSAQLAFGLAKLGCKVGLLDVDVCGPSIPTMMGLRGREVHQSASGWSPVYVDIPTDAGPEEEGELGVMSIGFLMPDQDAAVIWRGPRKSGLLTQFFGAVDWGELDYLVVDTPPGTSDEHISIVQLLKPTLGVTDGAVIVTTPQEVAMSDVRKELNFCKQTGIKVIGVVENMAPITVPLHNLQFRNDKGEDCTEQTLKQLADKCPEILKSVSATVDIFPRAGGGPEAMAKSFGVPFIGRVPLDRELQKACDNGVPNILSPSSDARLPLQNVVQQVIRATNPNLFVEKKQKREASLNQPNGGVVSVRNGKIAM
jgi:Mrp family chromosome partitioning ATPase